jgi:FPC/CPF motif-containing protein YcgG
MKQAEKVYDYDVGRSEEGDYPKAEILDWQSQFMATGLREESVYEQQIRHLIQERIKQANEQGIQINLGTLTLAMQRAYMDMIRWKNEMEVPKELIELDIKFLKEEIPRIVREASLGAAD